MITIDSLSVRRDGRTLSDGVTMHLAEGAVHGFSGTDDAVWTALFDALFGLVRPDAGGVTRFGRPLRRSETAYLERRIRFFDGLTVRDLLDFTARRHPGSDPETCIRLLGLLPDRQLTALPAAVQRKTALAATLMQRKPVLLLDEPFDGLDAESLEAAQRLILRRQAEGATVHGRRPHRRRIPARRICPRRAGTGAALRPALRRDDFRKNQLEKPI